MRKVVYTAIFGDKDEIKSIDRSKGIDYLVFTDDPMLRSHDFEIIVVPRIFDDPVLNAKVYKILQSKDLAEYDYSLWIDASMSVNGVDVNALFDNYLKDHDIALHKHPDRNCIYDEAEACIRHNKDNPTKISQQMETYRLSGYPKQNGLVSAGIIFRRHTVAISQLNEAWWREIMKHSRRDQLSFNYVVTATGQKYLALDGHVRNKNVAGFTLHSHKLPDFKNW